MHPVKGKALPPQARPDGLADHRVIFNEQQSHDRPYSTDIASLPEPHLDDPNGQLIHDAARLGVTLAASDAARLARLLDELERWNRTYNLTAIRERAAMVTHHLLDSLSVNADLAGTHIADVGTGAGFPGLPLAVVNPRRHFTLIDSNGKKIRFVEHAARELDLNNVKALHLRAEAIRVDTPFDTIVARAFASLPALLSEVQSMCGADTRVLAMKGKWPQAEINAIGPQWQHTGSHEIVVPGLAEARCVVVLSHRSTAPA
jgi:16S rRNA (guanine527-N7)-methyltransferase